jgi:hypothetical protein
VLSETPPPAPADQAKRHHWGKVIVLLVLALLVLIFLWLLRTPASPQITSAPPAHSNSPTVTFSYSDTTPGVTYSCAYDAGKLVPCSVHGVTYTQVRPGSHRFEVEADTWWGTHAATAYFWTTGTVYTISGNITQPLYPGTQRLLDIAITNPNPSPITISSQTITLTSPKPSCPVVPNYRVIQGLVTGLVIPGNSTRSLSELDVPQSQWPIVAMVETHTNQDACENVVLTLHYAGTATG